MKKTIVDTITSKIKRGEVKMKSRLSIMGEKLGINGGILAILSLLILTIGFVLYWINSNSDLLFGGYGKSGLSSFIQSFPYLFIVIFILLFLILIHIFRTFDFSYKRPFFILLLFVALGVLVAGWISIKQPIGQEIYRQEGRIFRMGMMNNSNAVTGIVIGILKTGILVEGEDSKMITVSTKIDTHFPFGQPKVGDQVRVVGTWEGQSFAAIGIRVFDETNPSMLGPGMNRGSGQGRGIKWNR